MMTDDDQVRRYIHEVMCHLYLKDEYRQRVRDFDVQSAAKIGDWPLVHIATGYNDVGRRNVARGIVAIGDIAIGGVAIGAVTVGVVAIGEISAGVIALGAVAAGLVVALGAGALSIVASVGAAAISVAFALGALALSRFWAIGAYARAIHYIDAYGESEVVPVWLRSFLEVFTSHPERFGAVMIILALRL